MYFINLIQSELKIPITPVQTHIDNVGAAYMADQVMREQNTSHCLTIMHENRFKSSKLFSKVCQHSTQL